MRLRFSLFALALLLALPVSAQELAATFVGRYETGLFDEGAAEIAAFDPATDRVFFVNANANAVVALDYSDPSNPTEAFSIDLDAVGALGGGSANSVAVRDGLVAVAVANSDPQQNGFVALFNTDGDYLDAATVGALPDMVAFVPGAAGIMSANEGEPNDDYTVDPVGSVSYVPIAYALSDGGGSPVASLGGVTTIGFEDFNAGGSRASELPDGVRIFGPNASVAQDLEPEFIAMSDDGSKAFVSLQENNAMAVIDVASRSVDAIYALGFKDFSQMANSLDPSNRDGAIAFGTFDNLFGMYQPDALASFTSGGVTYVVTANEGDARDYDGFSEEARVASLTLDPAAFPNAAALQADAQLGRLNVTTTLGDTDSDNDYDALYSYGARSFSIFNAATGALVYDSGDAIERKIAELLPNYFNSTDDENDSFDNRSDDKGPEPEGVVVGEVDGTLYAFVGLERVGGIMMFDLTDPTAPQYAGYINSRNFDADFTPDDFDQAGDLSPEGFVFVSAEDSPTGRAMLIVAHEVSGTVAGYALGTGAPFTLQILHAADQEAGLAATVDAINFSAVMERLDDDQTNTIRLSSGDLFIPGPFYNAADDVFGTDGFNAAGVGDILISNALGFQAAALGNHEFDQGTDDLARLITPNAGGDFSAIPGVNSYPGTAFPYLSANLDFSTDDNLDDLVVADAQAPQPNSVAASTVITVNGERIGIVGATTPALSSISSPGGVGVLPTDASDLDALAAAIQDDVDELTAVGIDKIVLLAHMQQIQIERQLATRLRGVDVIIAGGSNTLLANADDTLRDGDTRAGDYPETYTSASGEPVYLVNTDGNYQYVGNLVVTFEGGVIASVGDASGAYATDDAGVDRVYGMDVDPRDLADPVVVAVADAIGAETLARDGNLFGSASVYLDGRRAQVRSEETNLGNLTADANLVYAQQVDPAVAISIKNSGGIRAEIGRIVVPAGGTEPVRLPTEANPAAGKEEGDISQLDIENALAFNNGLTLLTLTASGLAEVVEYGIANAGPGTTSGRYPQVAGIRFAYDPTAADGEELRTLVVVDDEGNTQDIVVQDGAVVGDPDRTFRIVTLGFLANERDDTPGRGGDGYPFPQFGTDYVDLEALTTIGAGDATFADPGTEQDALAEYLLDTYSEQPFDSEETPASEDTRIVDVTRNSARILPDGIATVRSLEAGTEVEVEGIVTTPDFGFNNAEFYVQDATGGIKAVLLGSFGGNSDDTPFDAGDRIRLRGTLGQRFDEIRVEIPDADAFEILSEGNELPDAVRALPLGFDVDSPLQGTRVELPFVRLADPSAFPTAKITSGSGVTIEVVTLAGDTLDVRIDRDESFFDESAAPEGLFTLRGVLGRFREAAQLYPFFEEELDDMDEAPVQLFHASKAAEDADVQILVDLIPVGPVLSYGEATDLMLFPSGAAYEVSAATGDTFTDLLATAAVAEDEVLDPDGSIVIAAGDPNASADNAAFDLFASSLPEAPGSASVAAHFFHGVAGAGAVELRTLFPTASVLATQDEDDEALEFGDFSDAFDLEDVSYTFAVTPPDPSDANRDALARFGGDLGVAAGERVTLVVAGTTGGGLAADFFAVGADGSVEMLAATSVSLGDDAFDVPAELTLATPQPHPVTGSALVRFGLPQSGHARLVVFDALGRQVATLFDGEEAAGWHEARLDGGLLSSGVYLYRLESAGRSTTGALTVVR
jgi:2',3'-cyclic-nucleotide 2'-phosphodiesterase (5'-nucleotidase family)